MDEVSSKIKYVIYDTKEKEYYSSGKSSMTKNISNAKAYSLKSAAEYRRNANYSLRRNSNLIIKKVLVTTEELPDGS